MGNASALAGFLLLLGATAASPVSAQTPGLVTGAYERMSENNQKMARALFDAQAPAFVPAPRRSNAKSLTLDEIATQKGNGTTWDQVFSTMKSRGQLPQTSLGQVVSRYEHQSGRAALAATPKGKATER